jgi:hypothetical protein
VFTARYALSSYIKQIRFVFKGLIDTVAGTVHAFVLGFTQNLYCIGKIHGFSLLLGIRLEIVGSVSVWNFPLEQSWSGQPRGVGSQYRRTFAVRVTFLEDVFEETSATMQES